MLNLKKIKLTCYMKASSSSSVDATLLPFDDALLLPAVDEALLPFDDAVLLPFDAAVLLALVLGMKISSSSSLSAVHKNVCSAAVLMKFSLFVRTTLFHLASNL